jgi:hypothetical protein
MAMDAWWDTFRVLEKMAVNFQRLRILRSSAMS